MINPSNPDLLAPPRLVYLGDVPVEAHFHGSALIYRLLRKYPPQKLVIVESSIARSLPARRIPEVRYEVLRLRMGRLMATRFHRFTGSWATLRAGARARQIPALLGDAHPQAVLTVAHGLSWLTASAFAESSGLPLHLIVHDDWPQIATLIDPVRRWMERRYGEVYQRAASRLCVSPFMAEEYERRYGVKGTVLYPSRAADTPCFGGIGTDEARSDRPFTVAFAGSVFVSEYVRQLIALSRVLGGLRGRLLLYGSFDAKDLAAKGMEMENVEFGGTLASAELVRRLRAEADVLFVPESFAPSGSTQWSFPSKLTDYTAAALPLLIWGSKDSAAVRWAASELDAAALVTDPEDGAVAVVVESLAGDIAWRRRLSAAAADVGNRYFSSERADAVFYDALSSKEVGQQQGVR